MNTPQRQALTTIRRCIRTGRYRLTEHFTHRMDERGLFWPDVLSVFDAPTDATADGFDDAGRSRWIVSGAIEDGSPVAVVCAIGRDARGDLSVFITIYREGKP